MTPYQIDILLHYFCRVDDYPHEAPIFAETVAEFVAESLLEENPLASTRFVMTDRGRAYCYALQRVGLPESKWVMTWPTDSATGSPEGGR